MIHQDSPHVEHYIRQPDHSWLFIEYKGLDKTLEIKAAQCKLEMNKIYDKVMPD